MTPRNAIVCAAAAIVVAVAGASTVRATAVTPDDALRDLLGGVDFVPSAGELSPRLGDDPAASLVALATDDDDLDPGVRLRAVRALEHYPGDATRAALIATVIDKRESRKGVDLLYLHAAMRSLGAIGGDAVVDPIRPLLDHDNKDTRAAAAAALGASGSTPARSALYDRLGIETDEMVRLALSDAIRRLDEKQQ